MEINKITGSFRVGDIYFDRGRNISQIEDTININHSMKLIVDNPPFKTFWVEMINDADRLYNLIIFFKYGKLNGVSLTLESNNYLKYCEFDVESAKSWFKELANKLFQGQMAVFSWGEIGYFFAEQDMTVGIAVIYKE